MAVVFIRARSMHVPDRELSAVTDRLEFLLSSGSSSLPPKPRAMFST